MKRTTVNADVARFLDAWFAVRQFIQAANFNRFQGAGLSATQFMTLNLLPAEGEGLPIGELARRMNLKAATVAKTVDSMQARNLVIRMRSPKDRRVVMVQMTQAGMELQNAAHGQFQLQMERLFRSMKREERDGLVFGLESLVRTAAQQDSPLALAPGQTPSPAVRPDPRVEALGKRSYR